MSTTGSVPYDFLNSAIQSGAADARGVHHLFTESNTRTHWTLQWEGKTFVVVYDKGLGSVVTVLPHGAHETYSTTVPSTLEGQSSMH